MEDTRIIEVNGVKMEIDLRQAKVIDKYKVGDNVKVLIKEYGDSYKSYVGTIIGFDNFEKLPTIIIAYLKTDYSEVKIEFLHYNNKSVDQEITTLNDWDLPFKKSDILKRFDKEQEKKRQELAELEQKQNVFEKLFGKYFEEKIN